MRQSFQQYIFFFSQVLVDMIRVPSWAFEAAGQEMRGMGQDTAYHPGLYLTPTQVIIGNSYFLHNFGHSVYCVLRIF